MSKILQELKKVASTRRKVSNEWFFKTGKGQYGEGDKFIGVSNPDARNVVKKFSDASLRDIQEAINSKIHEERLVGILILVKQYEKATSNESRHKIATFYLRNLKRVNNWDLVDLSAHRIVGKAILGGIMKENILDTLAGSNNMWNRRVAIIATMAFIGEGKFDTTLRIAKRLIGDKEDLTHKAVGWTLREVWKKDARLCEKYLLENYASLPRTTLRYAIEKMEEGKRQKFLKKKM
jgi:3-methyladenine DNA glycosylase AlkD